MRPARAAALWAAVGSLTLTGCAFHGLYDIPLPGGAATENAYHVTVDFRDVLDLVPQSSVKVDNVTVGAVEHIALHGWHARVTLRVADHVKLPANAVAGIRQTSVLGEKYVALAEPDAVRPVGRLRDGARIPLSRSGRNPEIEEVLSALSALLNGGGVAQLHTITTELNKVLNGREDRVRTLLSELDTFVAGLDSRRTEIVRAMEGVDRLAKTLRREKATLVDAVDSIPPALKVLADQRRDLTRMLTALSDLGTVGTRVIEASKDDTIADLKALQPILDRLNQAGDDFPNALELLTTYPFPRNAVGAIKGDYTNLHITADINLQKLYGELRRKQKKDHHGGDEKKPDLPDLPEVPDLPDVPDLPETPHVPGTPDVPDAPKPPPGGDELLCPPVCSAGQAAYRATDTGPGGWPDGVDSALAELMTKGLLP